MQNINDVLLCQYWDRKNVRYVTENDTCTWYTTNSRVDLHSQGRTYANSTHTCSSYIIDTIPVFNEHMHVCTYARMHVYTCVGECVRACVRACVRRYVFVFPVRYRWITSVALLRLCLVAR